MTVPDPPGGDAPAPDAAAWPVPSVLLITGGVYAASVFVGLGALIVGAISASSPPLGPGVYGPMLAAVAIGALALLGGVGGVWWALGRTSLERGPRLAVTCVYGVIVLATQLVFGLVTLVAFNR